MGSVALAAVLAAYHLSLHVEQPPLHVIEATDPDARHDAAGTRLHLAHLHSHALGYGPRTHAERSVVHGLESLVLLVAEDVPRVADGQQEDANDDRAVG